MKTPRTGCTATIIGNRLYIFGGWNGKREVRIRISCQVLFGGCNYLRSVEVFNISGASCTPCHNHGIPDLKFPRGEHASVTRGNEVYFIDGARSRLASCESINVATCEGSELPPVLKPRAELSAVLFEGSIIAIGGTNCHGCHYEMDSVECFSFDTKQWSLMPPMTTPRRGHCAVVYQHQIFVIGGTKGLYDCNTIEVYDAVTNQWKVHSTLKVPKFAACVVKF